VTVTVPPAAAPGRDRVVADAAGLSRSFVQRLIADGRLTLDGRPVKSNTVLEPGAQPRARRAPRPADRTRVREGAARVLYEDDDVLVIDKPAGMTTHPAPGRRAGRWSTRCLVAADASAYGAIAGPERPGIVHRLDRDTSGLLSWRATTVPRQR
jgi:23S rRNA pseudouridine1911/1915/1917 synthase